jgi:hypothetical protein
VCWGSEKEEFIRLVGQERGGAAAATAEVDSEKEGKGVWGEGVWMSLRRWWLILPVAATAQKQFSFLYLV